VAEARSPRGKPGDKEAMDPVSHSPSGVYKPQRIRELGRRLCVYRSVQNDEVMSHRRLIAARRSKQVYHRR